MQVMSPNIVFWLCPNICHCINEKTSAKMHHPDSTVLTKTSKVTSLILANISNSISWDREDESFQFCKKMMLFSKMRCEILKGKRFATFALVAYR